MHISDVERDFDLIAHLPVENWNHNKNYHDQILSFLGWGLDHVLEIGCGKGDLARKLHAQSSCAIGIDVSAEMIATARKASPFARGLEFVCADYLKTEYPRGHFDAIVSVAAVHHMDFPRFLHKVRHELVSGGKLVVIDLYRDTRWSARLHDAAAFAATKYMHLRHNGKLFENRTSRKNWKMHSAGDTYLTMEEIAEAARRYLPGHHLRRLFFWRYWLSWVKGQGSSLRPDSLCSRTFVETQYRI